VRRWIAQPHGNGGLLVQATDSRGEPLAVIQPITDDELPYVSRAPSSVVTQYDTRCYFNVRSKADMSQLNLPHGNND